MKQNRKVITAFIFLIVMLWSSSVQGFALGQQYTIEQLGMNIELPQGLTPAEIVVPSSENTSSPALAAPSEIAGEAKQTYFSAATEDGSYSVSVVSQVTNESKDIFNYKYTSQRQMEKLVEKENKKKDVETSSFAELENCVLVLNYYITPESSGALSKATAKTIVNGREILVTFSVSSAQLSVQDKGVFASMANSIEFTGLEHLPLNVHIGEILVLTLWVMLVVLVCIIILLIIYYTKNGNPSMSFLDMTVTSFRNRDVASKYYDELRRDGFWSETMQIDKLDENGNPVVTKPTPVKKADGSIEFVTFHKGVKTVVATVDQWKQMSLSKEEWAEKFEEELSDEPENEEDYFFTFNDGEGPLFDAPQQRIEGARLRPKENGVELSRNNNDDFDEFEEVIQVVNADKTVNRKEFAQPQRYEIDLQQNKQAENMRQADEEKQSEPTQTEKPAGEEPEIPQGFVWEESKQQGKRTDKAEENVDSNKTSSVVKEFETDSYWDKYR